MTGARRAEMEHLRWDNVDFERGLVHIEPDPATGWSPKNETSVRAVPMCPELRAILADLQRTRRPDVPHVFCLPNGEPILRWPDYPLRRLQSAIRWLRRKKINVRSGTLRMLRHWFISSNLNRRENPLNPVEMTKLVGHTHMEMICRAYYHADQAKIREKMETFKVVGGPRPRLSAVKVAS